MLKGKEKLYVDETVQKASLTALLEVVVTVCYLLPINQMRRLLFRYTIQ